MKLSDHALTLLKKEEGFSAKAYKDDHSKTSKIEYSIGYGHQITANETRLLTSIINESTATVLLKTDVVKAEKYVSQFGSFTQNQFDALVLLAYNVGSFQSGLIGLIKAKNWKAIPDKIKEYNKSGGEVNPVLVKRRSIEADLFKGLTANYPVLGVALLAILFLFK